MRSTLLAVAVLLVVLPGSSFAADDEFDDENFDAAVLPTAASAAPAKLAAAHIPSPPPLNISERLRAHDWSMEIAFAVLLLGYFGYYIRGRGVNAQIAADVAGVLTPVLTQQFSSVGMGSADDGSAPWIRESDTGFTMWSSGRKNCLGLHAELKLKPRQDALVTLFGKMVPFLGDLVGGVVDHDTLTLEAPLSAPGPDADSFVLGLATSPAERKALIAANRDLEAYGTTVLTAASSALQLPPGCEIATEHREIPWSVLRGESFARMLTSSPEAAKALRTVHITSESALCKKSMRTHGLSPRVLKFEFRLPASEAEAGGAAGRERLDVLRPWLLFLLTLVDAAPTLKLSKAAKTAVTDVRARLEKEANEKAIAEELAKRARRTAAAKAEARLEEKKAYEAKLAAMDRDSRRKQEEKDRLEALERMLPKQKRK